MSAVFVIPASDTLVSAIETVRPIVDGDPKQTKALYKTIGNAYVDAVVDGMVLDYIRESGSAKPRTRSLVETLASLIKSVAHGLVGHAFGKLTPDHARAVLAYLDERASRYHDGPGLSAPIGDDAARGIESAVAALSSDDLAARRQLLKATMHTVIERAMEYHYQKPFSLLELGFLTRKAVDVGYDTITRGSISTINSALDDAEEPQLRELTEFLARRLMKGAQPAS